jgi:hypothetical protein
LLATRREEDGHVVDSLRLALILHTETIQAARRSHWRACLVKGELRSTAPWRGGCGWAREHPETSREREAAEGIRVRLQGWIYREGCAPEAV